MTNRLLFFAGVLLGMNGGLVAAGNGSGQIAKMTPEEIANRIKQLKPAQEMNWTRIPWTGSLLAARQASQQEKCPVFLFSLDGNISTGRC